MVQVTYSAVSQSPRDTSGPVTGATAMPSVTIIPLRTGAAGPALIAKPSAAISMPRARGASASGLPASHDARWVRTWISLRPAFAFAVGGYFSIDLFGIPRVGPQARSRTGSAAFGQRLSAALEAGVDLFDLGAGVLQRIDPIPLRRQPRAGDVRPPLRLIVWQSDSARQHRHIQLARPHPPAQLPQPFSHLAPRAGRLPPAGIDPGDAAFEIGDGRRHFGVAGVGDAAPLDLDRAYAAETRRRQRVAPGLHFFQRHGINSLGSVHIGGTEHPASTP